MKDERLPARFWAKVRQEGDCHVWQAGGTVNGYGLFSVKCRMRLAHRVAFATLVGPIPTGMQVHHKCFNRRCVNVEHLALATPQRNAEERSGPNSNTTSGIRNVYWHPASGKWMVSVGHEGAAHYGGLFIDVSDAAAAAEALRAGLHAEVAS